MLEDMLTWGGRSVCGDIVGFAEAASNSFYTK